MSDSQCGRGFQYLLCMPLLRPQDTCYHKVGGQIVPVACLNDQGQVFRNPFRFNPAAPAHGDVKTVNSGHGKCFCHKSGFVSVQILGEIIDFKTARIARSGFRSRKARKWQCGTCQGCGCDESAPRNFHFFKVSYSKVACNTHVYDHTHMRKNLAKVFPLMQFCFLYFNKSGYANCFRRSKSIRPPVLIVQQPVGFPAVGELFPDWVPA